MGVATPHWDLYDENLADYERVCADGPRGGIPVPVRGSPMVRFNVAEMGRRIGGFITRARRATPEMLGQIPEPPEAPLEGGGGTLLPTRGDGAPAASQGGGDEEDIWVAMETRHGVEEGAS